MEDILVKLCEDNHHITMMLNYVFHMEDILVKLCEDNHHTTMLVNYVCLLAQIKLIISIIVKWTNFSSFMKIIFKKDAYKFQVQQER